MLRQEGELLTVPQVLSLCVATIAEEQHDFPLRETIAFCLEHVAPAFAAVLSGEQEGGTVELRHPIKGTVISINLNQVCVAVLPELGLGEVHGELVRH
jgi:hypothetical protein